MAKQSLLDLVQNILFAMDSDPVNSISDTIESMQVATIIQDTFYEIINDRLWPRNKELLTLYPSTDKDNPVLITIPPSVSKIDWIRYSIGLNGDQFKEREIQYKDPDEFIRFTNDYRNLGNAEYGYILINGRRVYHKNNAMPTYWTSFDDETILFDSYNRSEEDTITADRMTVYGYTEPLFSMEDNFIPDLPSKAFPYFLSEAKSVAFNQIKQAANQKEEQRSKRQRKWLAREKFVTGGGIKFIINYGRK